MATEDRSGATRDLRADAWAFVERMAREQHDLSTPVMPSNIAAELLATKADLIRAYELKVEDFAKETRRASYWQEACEREHQALMELWRRFEDLRRSERDAD